MKRVILLLAAVFLTLGTLQAQNIVIGERAPELKNITWLSDRQPVAAEFTLLVFFHSSNEGCIRALSNLEELSSKLGSKLRIVVVTQEEAGKIAPILSPRLSPRFGVALDPTKRTFSGFGVEFVPFSVLIDSRNRVVWMGNPMTVTSSFIQKITQ